MNNPLLVNESSRLISTRRRWKVILGTLLTINFALVVAAGYSHSTPAASEASLSEAPVSSDPPSPEVAVETSPSSATAESGSVSPAPALPAAGEGVSAITPDLPAEDPSIPVVDGSAIVIVNAQQSGGVVHYLLDETVCHLEPGEYQEIHGSPSKRLSFHKGDEFEDETREIQPGVFVFNASAEGWQLELCPASDTANLLSGCRKAVSQ